MLNLIIKTYDAMQSLMIIFETFEHDLKIMYPVQ